MINEELRALADRWIRLTDEIDERKKDLKEVELEAKAKGHNVSELRKWCKAESADKIEKRKTEVAEAVMIGQALGHDTGFGDVPTSRGERSGASLELLKSILGTGGNQ